MLYDHRFLALQIQPLDTSVDVICPLRQCSDCSNSGLCNRVFAKYYLYHNIIQFSLPISKTFHFHLAHLCSSPTIDIDIYRYFLWGWTFKLPYLPIQYIQAIYDHQDGCSLHSCSNLWIFLWCQLLWYCSCYKGLFYKMSAMLSVIF